VKDLKVYLSVPIILNRDLNFTVFLRKTIEDAGNEVVSKWVSEPDPGFSIAPSEVFERDTCGVRESDCLVADISVPSHGVGLEIMLAFIEGKKIILLSKKGATISRMIRGIPGAVFVEYSSNYEIVDELKKMLTKK
jgi:hypothetical protein